MTNPNREFDKSHLSVETAEDRVMFHRDYFAHMFRWSHVIKYLYGKRRYQTAKILDVGCGKEMPLARALYSNKMSGASYAGVDLNKLTMPEMLVTAVENGKIDIAMYPESSILDMGRDSLPFIPNIITNFEVFEHMAPKHARKSLETMHHLLSTDGVMFFSTPAWNGKAAGNHINETTYEAMGFILEDVGFEIIDHFGTFASIADYKDAIYEDGFGKLFERMREYYDTNTMSCFFAPMYPQYARNILWELRRNTGADKVFPEPQKSWSQHPDWEDMR